jgi:hypothetical protein
MTEKKPSYMPMVITFVVGCLFGGMVVSLFSSNRQETPLTTASGIDTIGKGLGWVAGQIEQEHREKKAEETRLAALSPEDRRLELVAKERHDAQELKNVGDSLAAMGTLMKVAATLDQSGAALNQSQAEAQALVLLQAQQAQAILKAQREQAKNQTSDNSSKVNSAVSVKPSQDPDLMLLQPKDREEAMQFTQKLSVQSDIAQLNAALTAFEIQIDQVPPDKQILLEFVIKKIKSRIAKLESGDGR